MDILHIICGLKIIYKLYLHKNFKTSSFHEFSKIIKDVVNLAVLFIFIKLDFFSFYLLYNFSEVIFYLLSS